MNADLWRKYNFSIKLGYPIILFTKYLLFSSRLVFLFHLGTESVLRKN